MIAVDTNVLISLLTERSPRELELAERLFKSNTCWISSTVLLEMVWVLKRAFGMPRQRVAETIEKVIAPSNVILEHPDAITRALDLYRGGFDFADAVHLLLADRGQVAGFATFDRDFARRANMDFPGLKVAAPQDFAA